MYEIGQLVTDEDGTKNEVVAIEEVESEEGHVLTVIRWQRVEDVGGETTDWRTKVSVTKCNNRAM